MNARTPALRAPDLSHRTLGIAGISVATLFWGLVPLVLKQINMPTLAFAAWRLWFGVIVYGVTLLVSGRHLRWTTVKTCALGGVFFAGDVALSFSAFRLTSVANATIIGSLSVVFITIGAARWFGERMDRASAALVALSLAGVALVAVGGNSGEASRIGDLCAGAGTLTWAAYWLFSKRSRAGASALDYMATVMLVAAPTLTIVAAVSHVTLAPPHGSDLAWVVAVTLLPGAIGHVLVAWSHRHVEAWLGSLITQCVPVVSSIAALVLLDESLTALTIMGGVVVIGATAGILWRTGRRPGEEQEIVEAAGPGLAGADP
jgi:DME family drug/metabolite transporter